MRASIPRRAGFPGADSMSQQAPRAGRGGDSVSYWRWGCRLSGAPPFLSAVGHCFWSRLIFLTVAPYAHPWYNTLYCALLFHREQFESALSLCV